MNVECDTCIVVRSVEFLHSCVSPSYSMQFCKLGLALDTKYIFLVQITCHMSGTETFGGCRWKIVYRMGGAHRAGTCLLVRLSYVSPFCFLSRSSLLPSPTPPCNAADTGKKRSCNVSLWLAHFIHHMYSPHWYCVCTYAHTTCAHLFSKHVQYSAEIPVCTWFLF